ncbi:MAG TPA: HupE/UreJ family protein [Thermoanaerobaculia bacterium]|nr:HupE/UreJ family protein [Thermoanaerobaculia bacterium]
MKRDRKAGLGLGLGLGFFLLLVAASVHAHEIGTTQVRMAIGGGTWTASITTAPLSLLNKLEVAAGQPRSGALDAAALRAKLMPLLPQLAKQIDVRFDGAPSPASVAIAALEVPADISRPAYVVLNATGSVPTSARTLTWAYGLTYSTYALMLDGRTVWVEGDARCAPLPLVDTTPPPTRGRIIAQYLVLGFEHILPKGLDHILFILGIFLLTTRLKPILTQVTAFTIAHSITLGLTMYGLVSLPSRIVEPLIAVSIAYVAIENVVTTELKPWRPAVVFAFGLLHGMGFAGVLRELKLPRGEFVPALVSFNAGIELAQLAVVGAAFVLVAAWFRNSAWYRPRFVIPASMLIALTGLFWTVQRVVGF